MDILAYYISTLYPINHVKYIYINYLEGKCCSLRHFVLKRTLPVSVFWILTFSQLNSGRQTHFIYLSISIYLFTFIILFSIPIFVQKAQDRYSSIQCDSCDGWVHLLNCSLLSNADF